MKIFSRYTIYMTARIGLISDIHATPGPLSEALDIFEQQQVDLILCPGDIAGYGNDLDETIDLLVKSDCKSIQGNHEAWYMEKAESTSNMAYQYFKSLPRTLRLNIENITIFMVHANPPEDSMGGIRLLDQEGNLDNKLIEKWTKELTNPGYDVLIVGHTHQVFAQHLGNVLVINPGSTTYNHCCAILNLPGLTVEFHALSGKKILRNWNWGLNHPGRKN